MLLTSLLLKMLRVLLLLDGLLNQMRDQGLQPPPHAHIALIKIAVKNNVKFSNCLPRTFCECQTRWWRREGDRGQQLRVIKINMIIWASYVVTLMECVVGE